jgi:acetyl esterase/lipase
MTSRFSALICLFAICVFVIPIGAQQNAKPAANPTRDSTQQENQSNTKPAPQPSQKSMREIVMMPVVSRVAGMDKVTVKSNLKYTSTDDPNLLMDVYSPPGLAKGGRRPAVIFVHGGAGSETTPKDWGIYTSWGRLVAASGLVGVTFTHRLSPQRTSMEASADDLAAAINYVRTNADSLNIDKDRICLAAYSAGGPLLSPVLRDKPAYVRCLVAYYAYMDVQQSGNLFLANESAETLRKFSPITYLSNDSGKVPPLFIARAGRDQVPAMNDSIDRFAREALIRNVTLTIANHPTGVHGFDNQNDDARSREIIQNSIAFMKFHLGLAGGME